MTSDAPPSNLPNPFGAPATDDAECISETASTGTDSEPRSRLSTKGLVRRYGKRNVVDGVSIHVDAGEVVGLLGPNGAGKTTTFYMIVGLIRPTAGNVRLDDTAIDALPMYQRARRGIGYLPQEPSVFRKLTVFDNIKAIVETLDIPRKQQRDYILEHLEELHLLPVKDQKAYTLSGGERRRLEITRALVTRPRFLLLDEPFSGVDPISVHEVQEIIARLRDKGIGILITDHNVRETLAITNRACIMYDGKVLCEGARETLIHDEQARRFYLGATFETE